MTFMTEKIKVKSFGNTPTHKEDLQNSDIFIYFPISISL